MRLLMFPQENILESHGTHYYVYQSIGLKILELKPGFIRLQCWCYGHPYNKKPLNIESKLIPISNQILIFKNDLHNIIQPILLRSTFISSNVYNLKEILECCTVTSSNKLLKLEVSALTLLLDVLL